MVLGGEKYFQYKGQIEETYIFSKDKVVLLGITVDNKLNPQFMWCFFENHEIPYNLGSEVW